MVSLACPQAHWSDSAALIRCKNPLSRDIPVRNYSPDIEWYDHAFLVQRVRHEQFSVYTQRSNTAISHFVLVLRLVSLFTQHASQKVNLACRNTDPQQAIIPTSSGAVLEQAWHGKCVNNIIRPDGQDAVEASGKEFVCLVCMVMGIDSDGKIRGSMSIAIEDGMMGLTGHECLVQSQARN